MMSVSSKELRGRAWARLKGNYWKSFGASIVGNIVGSVGLIFTAGPMTAGLARYYVKQQREENPEFGEIFSGFSRYGSTLGGYILRCLFIFLWGIIPIVGQFFAVWVKPFAYSQMYYLMMDEGLGANESITRSKEMMAGYKWKLFCLEFSFIGWILLCLLTFGIGWLFLMPYYEAAHAEFYAELVECHKLPSERREEGEDPFANQPAEQLVEQPVEEPVETPTEESAEAPVEEQPTESAPEDKE